MIIEDQLDRSVRGIGGINKSEELDELSTAVAIFDKSMDLATRTDSPYAFGKRPLPRATERDNYDYISESLKPIEGARSCGVFLRQPSLQHDPFFRLSLSTREQRLYGPLTLFFADRLQCTNHMDLAPRA